MKEKEKQEEEEEEKDDDYDDDDGQVYQVVGFAFFSSVHYRQSRFSSFGDMDLEAGSWLIKVINGL